VLDFDGLYADHARPLLGFLILRTGDRVLSEDLLAETFVRALSSRQRFDPRRGSEKTWLYTIALNLLRDHVRREATAAQAFEQFEALEDRRAPSEGIVAIESQDAVHRALRVLSDEEREVVALRFTSDLSVPQIARALNQRRTTVEGRLYGALRKLRLELGE
jgi:RNA polymerase sigma-70 factor (ECF subfamily)